jgi:AcrR family transcriptional regulator
MHTHPDIPTLPPAQESLPTRQRILDAAYRVCAEQGLHGATTREIADAARVNEVTLFRHFGSKEKLITALFQRSVAAQTESLSDNEPDGEDLQPALLRYARRYNHMLFEHEALIRTIIAEAPRHPDQAKQVISDAAKPLRQRLLAFLEIAQSGGAVRSDVALSPAVDAFTGMLLSGMLRRTGKAHCLDYAQEDYVSACVDLFYRGIAAPAKRAKGRRRA